MVLTLAIITGNGGEVVTPLLLLCVIGCWISGLLTVSIDFLYGKFKVVTKPVDKNHSKGALDDIEKSRQYNYLMTIP